METSVHLLCNKASISGPLDRGRYWLAGCCYYTTHILFICSWWFTCWCLWWWRKVISNGSLLVPDQIDTYVVQPFKKKSHELFKKNSSHIKNYVSLSSGKALIDLIINTSNSWMKFLRHHHAEVPITSFEWHIICIDSSSDILVWYEKKKFPWNQFSQTKKFCKNV